MCFKITSMFLSAEKWVRGRAIDRGEIEIGTQQSQTVPPGLFWRFHMTVHHPTYIKFNLSLSHNALLGVYGRRNIPPTHTQVMAVMLFTHDIFDCMYMRLSTVRMNLSAVHNFFFRGKYLLIRFNSGIFLQRERILEIKTHTYTHKLYTSCFMLGTPWETKIQCTRSHLHNISAALLLTAWRGLISCFWH